MIKVTVELWPAGDAARAKKIGWRMRVWNTDPSLPSESIYDFQYNTKGSTVSGEGIEHERRYDVWRLIRAVLNHSEPDPEYCKTCHCHLASTVESEIQFDPAGLDRG